MATPQAAPTTPTAIEAPEAAAPAAPTIPSQTHTWELSPESFEVIDELISHIGIVIVGLSIGPTSAATTAAMRAAQNLKTAAEGLRESQYATDSETAFDRVVQLMSVFLEKFDSCKSMTAFVLAKAAMQRTAVKLLGLETGDGGRMRGSEAGEMM